DELLLFMHHVRYSHLLHSGKTVIQHIYDSHYEGAEEAARFVDQWKSLKGSIDDRRYDEILERLEYQAGHAEVWRDAICDWFLHESRIPDAKGRAGHFPGRIEAERMTLEGYAVQEINPWEAASRAKAVSCKRESECRASFDFGGKAGRYDIAVRYFDQNNGASRFKLFVAGREIDHWTADAKLPTDKLDSHSATRRLIEGVPLRPGVQIRIEGLPDGGESAAVDFVEVRPARAVKSLKRRQSVL